MISISQDVSTKSQTEKIMYYLGLPLALIVFASIASMTTPEGISYAGKMSMATFAFALILWVCDSIPTYVTSMIVLVLLSVFGGWAEKSTLGVFGYYVIWLMVSAFIITAGMEKSGFAKRMALWIITRFGKTPRTVLFSLICTNFLIAFIVPSTTARAAMMLPIVMLVAHAYQVNKKENRNLGRLLAIQGLQANNLSTTAIVTATAPQILAIGFIKDLAGTDVSWMDWFVAAAPISLLSLIASFLIGLALFNPGKGDATGSHLDKLKDEYSGLGKMTSNEIKALVIFSITIFLWATNKWHTQMFGFEISLVMVAIISAILFFLPYIGILSWKESNIPWNLMVFSAGAYGAGISLSETGVASWALENVFTSIGVENMGFTTLFISVILISSFSHFLFTSKTVRTVILIPTVIGLANVAGINPLALALPAAFTIADTITLPPHCKPNLIYYSTGFFTVTDQLVYGVLTLLAKCTLLFLASFTWFKLIGIM